MNFIKSLHPDDYKNIQIQVSYLRSCYKELTDNGIRIDIGNDHRYWEYGNALKLLIENNHGTTGTLSILDIGSGVGLLGPSLAMAGISVTEVEPERYVKEERQKLNKYLKDRTSFIGKQIWHISNEFHNTVCQSALDNYYDAVFCISVIEHLPVDLELEYWKLLADRVKPDGVLFITVDIMPNAEPHHFDNLRQTNFQMEMIKRRVEVLKSYGMKPVGEEDYRYHGSFVYDDYSFFCIGMKKCE